MRPASSRMHAFMVALMLVEVPVAAPPADYTAYNEVVKYDHHFSKYSKRYFSVAFDWLYFKAQAVAESNLRPDARSPAGALGLMQIMPGTFEDIRRWNREIKGPVTDPRWNIAAGIFYDKRQYEAWREGRLFEDRLRFMFGSYNAGPGNIRSAERVAEDAGLDGALWGSIEQVLPCVTAGKAQETLTYVRRVFTVKGDLR